MELRRLPAGSAANRTVVREPSTCAFAFPTLTFPDDLHSAPIERQHFQIRGHERLPPIPARAVASGDAKSRMSVIEECGFGPCMRREARAAHRNGKRGLPDR